MTDSTDVRDSSRDAYFIEEEFFDEAGAMRHAVEQHFGNPERHERETHEVWNYWYYPGLYTYMRSDPYRVIPHELVSRFEDRLYQWAINRLGVHKLSSPRISLYINGCGQGLHNDSKNGRWGYVYSLTPWETRSFTGGETILFRDEKYWESERITNAGAGEYLYEMIPARFNQLLVFDGRMVHGVTPFQGNMNPNEGRVVIHGHIEEEGYHIKGPLLHEQTDGILEKATRQVTEQVEKKYGAFYHGLLTMHVEVLANGKVGSVEAVSDRIVRLSSEVTAAETVTGWMMEQFRKLRFPAADEASEILFPIALGPAARY